LGAVLPDKLTRMYFVNSGAEANDAAIKLARKIRGRSKVVSTVRGFHGRTQATWNATGGESQVGQFPSSRANTEFVPYGNINAMTAAIDGNTAAVIIEPIQGEGGIRIPPAGYLAQVRELCSQAGACLIIDEIQTGFCRTGSLFALQQESVAVAPDFMTMGKGIGGGFPFAGFAVSEAIASQIQAGDHGGTYAGNPLGCAVAAEVVKFLIEQDVSANVRHAGDLLCDRLLGLQRRFPQIIQEVRGRGLMLALQLPDDAVVGRLCSFCLDEELIVTPTRGAVIRLLPSLLITTEEIDHAVSRLALALGRLASTAHVSCDRLPRSMPA
ncbi:MAG: aminotransferase class III-fold pyridoxal phosphate-dependent enzyme, partial [Gammaproteobacteria bacterium]